MNDWAGPIALATGFQHRREGGSTLTDAFGEQNYSLSNNGSTYSGSFQVSEGYVELGIPLAKDTSWANSMDADLAYRMTGYSTSGNRASWKGGLNWQINSDVRFRGTISRDVREPAISDLYAVQTLGITASFSNPFQAYRARSTRSPAATRTSSQK